MNFKKLLISANNGDSNAINKLLDMYRPLLIKESINNKTFDEDLYQELQEVFLRVLKTFKA